MDGVTILNTITENVPNTAGFVVLLIFSIVLIILLFIAIIAVSDKFSEFNGFVIAYIIMEIFGILFLIVSILGLNTLSQEPQTLYEVIISEEVSFKDFTSKYEIIEQRGEIYVVKKRERNDKENQNQWN